MSRKSHPEIALLLEILDEAYEKAAWHGPNLRGALRGVTPREAAWRPAPGRHNIRELAVHAAYWKYTAWRRLTGAKRGSFSLPGSNWFRRPGPPTEKAWRSDVALLDEQHRRLHEAVADLPPSRLDHAPAGERYSNRQLIHGVAAHDVYHAGQIQLLKALKRKSRAR